MIDTQTKMLDYGIKAGTLTNDQVKTFFETGINTGASGVPAQGRGAPCTAQGGTFQMPVENAKITSGYGERKDPFTGKLTNHPAIDFGAPEGSAVKPISGGKVIDTGTDAGYGNFVRVQQPDGSIIQYSHLKDINVKNDQPLSPSDVIGTVGSTGKSTGSHLDLRAWDSKGNPFDLTNMFGKPAAQATAPTAGATPKTEQELLKMKAQAEQDILKNMSENEIKAYGEKRDELLKYQPTTLKTQMNDYDNLAKYLTNKDYTKVVGLLQQRAPGSDTTYFGKFINALQGAAAGAEKGITMGQFGSISLPVEEMIRGATLTEKERIAFNEIQRIIKSGLISSIAQSGKVLGTNPTDADARLFEAAAASPSNLAANTLYWAQMRRAQTEFLHDAHRGMRDYGLGKHPGVYFTDQSSPFFRAEDNFYKNMDTIQSKAPGLQ